MLALFASACDRAPARDAVTGQSPSVASLSDPVPAENMVTDQVLQNMAEVEVKTPVRDLPENDDSGNATQKTAPFPAEVTDFMVTRDGCDHFRGEEPYDEERRAYLEDNVQNLCTGSDAKLTDLRHRYAKDADVMMALKNYEIEIDATPE